MSYEGFYPSSRNSCHLSRYDRHGNIDASFGLEGGIIESLFPETSYFLDNIYISENNEIFIPGVAGRRDAEPSLIRDEMLLVKYDSSGLLDDLFGGNGILMTGFKNTRYSTGFTDLSANGFLLCGFGALIDPEASEIRQKHLCSLLAFNAGGSINRAFGEEGILIFDTQIFCPKIAVLLSDGNIACGGSIPDRGGAMFVISKLSPNGSYVEDFGESGRLVVDIFPHGDYSSWSSFDDCIAIIELSNSQLIAVADTDGYDRRPAILKINPDGTLDNTFAEDGVLRIFDNYQPGMFRHNGFGVDEVNGHIVISGDKNDVPTVERYDLNSGALVVSEVLNLPEGAKMNSMVVHSDGSLLFGGSIGTEAALVKMHYGDIIYSTETAAADALSISPNPTGGEVTVTLSGEVLGEVALYDSMGRQLLVQHSEDNTLQIALPPLSGLYHLTITTPSGNRYHQKVVRE